MGTFKQKKNFRVKRIKSVEIKLVALVLTESFMAFQQIKFIVLGT